MSSEQKTSQARDADHTYRAPRATDPIRAHVDVPGSKSLTNRELVLAAIADAPSRIIAPLVSDDSAHMIASLRALGATIEPTASADGKTEDLLVTPAKPFSSDFTIDCGQAGTVMRFVAPLAGLAHGNILVTAHETALHRPMGEMITALRDIGVDIDDGGKWSLPFMVKGHGQIRGGEVRIDASRSSQFVSGILLAAARFDVGIHLTHTGERLPSLPHIEMTIESLAHRGVHVETPNPGEWIVPAGPIRGKDITIEPDLSNAAPFLCAAVVTGGSVSVPRWPSRSTQPGALLTEILPQFGARVSRHGGTLTVTGTGKIHGVDLDLTAAGELAPNLVGLATLADSPSTFRGIGHIRQHETDRIAALISEIESVGGRAEELEDGIRVIPQAMTGGTWRAHHDHRMATTGAIIGLAVDGVVIDDITTTAKTLPQFKEMWQQMLAGENGERIS